MQVMRVVDWLALGLIVGVPLASLIIIVIQHILGYYLANKYDPPFFKPPYFTEGEVGVYSAWPLSLIRYATYIVFAGFPWLVHRRRFKGHVSPYLPGKYLKLACQVWFVSLIMLIFSVPVLFLLMFTLPSVT